jgi:sporulation protein YlmC with PRC-barrel domain
VMVGAGGLLGVGERDVQLPWKDLVVMEGGRKVVVDMTKDQLKALPEYKYRNTAWRGQVFNDQGPYRGTAASDRASSAGRDTAATTSTRDFNAKGGLSADAVIGAKVKNKANETVGTVEDVYLDKSGSVQEVVVSVGGFLGVGKKDVAVKWSDFQVGRDGDSVVLTTNWTKDSLKAMPEYKHERREQAQQR